MKAVYILSLVAVLASCVLGWMNRSKFLALRASKDDATRQVHTLLREETQKLNEEAASALSAWTEQITLRNQENYAKKGVDSNIADKTKEDEALIAETTDYKQAVEKLKNEFQAILADLGVSTPDELVAKRDALKAETEEQIKLIGVLDKEIEILKGIIGENEKTIARYASQQEQRNKSISLSSREGIITAVNPDWGFCILDLGSSDGVSNESKLLVKRGAQLIGKLKIIQIESGLTVADIDQKSLAPNMSVAPGDQVIFDTAN